MAKIGRKTRLWLKGFHELFFILWIGAAVSANTIGYLTGNATTGAELSAYYSAIDKLDIIILPAAGLTLVSGLLIFWLGGWGFKHFFVMYSLAVMLIAIVLGPAILGPSTSTLVDLSDSMGISALQDTEYQQTKQLLTIVSTIQVVLLISAAFVCIFKPMERLFTARKPRQVTEAAHV